MTVSDDAGTTQYYAADGNSGYYIGADGVSYCWQYDENWDYVETEISECTETE